MARLQLIIIPFFGQSFKNQGGLSFAFDHEAAEAHRSVEQRIPISKVLLDPTQSADHPVEN